ncbi:MAG: NAD-dependent epimerase/dehydratase [Lachnospiraceae bacterium]|nr:NAD-dependent epimerase/dehydratase [Lachnospiraceae bacterium]
MKAIVTGAAGFTGYSLVNELSNRGYYVYALVRPGSRHNGRLVGMDNVELVETDLIDTSFEAYWDKVQCDYLFHLAWNGGRFDRPAQMKNIDVSLKVVDLAKAAGCNRIIITGSQAEYGVTDRIQTEDLETNPVDPYGEAKVEICRSTKVKADEVGIDWIWGRIFSLYGKYEPVSRMLPALICAMKKGEVFSLSSCKQNWDYLEVRDAANALIALAEKGRNGEIYNIAHGEYRKLMEFTEVVRRAYPQGKIIYGKDAEPFVSLQPSVKKIVTDTGWIPKYAFEECLDYEVAK